MHFVLRKSFLLVSFHRDQAWKDGLRVRWWDFLFYALFGLVVTIFVRVAGVLLVFSYLIVPAVCAITLARTIGCAVAHRLVDFVARRNRGLISFVLRRFSVRRRHRLHIWSFY